MLVSEAAKELGMNTQTLRLGLQQDKFPFGVAIRTSENRYTYYVNRNRLERYLGGGYEDNSNHAISDVGDRNNVTSHLN